MGVDKNSGMTHFAYHLTLSKFFHSFFVSRLSFSFSFFLSFLLSFFLSWKETIALKDASYTPLCHIIQDDWPLRFVWRTNMSYDMTKSTKLVCAQRRLRSAGHPPSLVRVFAVFLIGSFGPKFSSRGYRDSDQADLRLRWAHSHFVGFAFWFGWAMVLGSFQCRGVLLLLHILEQGPAELATSVGRVGYNCFISYGAFVGWGNESLFKRSRSPDQDGRHAHIWKKPKKSASLELKRRWSWNLVCSIRRSSTTKFVQMMTLGWPWPILRHGQIWSLKLLYEKNVKQWIFQKLLSSMIWN